jgi:hypothetical protein
MVGSGDCFAKGRLAMTVQVKCNAPPRCVALDLSVQYIIRGSEATASEATEVMMIKFRPYLLDLVVGVIFILLPGIRGYANWQIYEYALLVVIYGYIVYLHHKK